MREPFDEKRRSFPLKFNFDPIVPHFCTIIQYIGSDSRGSAIYIELLIMKTKTFAKLFISCGFKIPQYPQASIYSELLDKYKQNWHVMK